MSLVRVYFLGDKQVFELLLGAGYAALPWCRWRDRPGGDSGRLGPTSTVLWGRCVLPAGMGISVGVSTVSLVRADLLGDRQAVRLG